MDINIEIEALKSGLARIENLISDALGSEKKREKIYDNADVLKLLHVSRRTLATWRDKGVISFSQYAGKIYYAQDDLDAFLKNYHIKTRKV